MEDLTRAVFFTDRRFLNQQLPAFPPSTEISWYLQPNHDCDVLDLNLSSRPAPPDNTLGATFRLLPNNYYFNYKDLPVSENGVLTSFHIDGRYPPHNAPFPMTKDQIVQIKVVNNSSVVPTRVFTPSMTLRMPYKKGTFPFKDYKDMLRNTKPTFMNHVITVPAGQTQVTSILQIERDTILSRASSFYNPGLNGLMKVYSGKDSSTWGLTTSYAPIDLIAPISSLSLLKQRRPNWGGVYYIAHDDTLNVEILQAVSGVDANYWIGWVGRSW